MAGSFSANLNHNTAQLILVEPAAVNTAININWRAGAAFEKATTVLGPRIAKFGVKFNW